MNMACKSALCEPCLYVDLEIEAEGFCSTCAECLCSKCIIEHKKVKLTRNHVVTRDNVPNNGGVIREMNEMLACAVHKEMKISYKCNDHMTYMCTVCRVDTHMNCEHVFEIAKCDGVLEDIHGSLAELKLSTASLKERKQENRKLLYQSQADILSEQEMIIQKAINALEELKVKLAKDTDEKLQVAVSEIDKDIESVNVIEQRTVKNIEILEAAEKYGDITCFKVIEHLLADDILKKRDRVKDIDQQEEYQLLFVKNEDTVQTPSLGTLSLVRNERTENKHECFELGIEKTSDEFTEIEMSSSQSENTVVTVTSLQTEKAVASSSQTGNTVVTSSHTENAVASSSQTGNTVVTSSQTKNAVASSSQTGNTVVTSSHTENTIASSSQTGNTVATSSQTENAVASSSQAENTVVTSSHTENAFASSSQSGNTVITSSDTEIAVASSSQTGNTVITSSHTENTIANSSQTGNTVVTSSHTGNAVANSSWARAAVANNSQTKITDVNILPAENPGVKAETRYLPTISESFVTEKQEYWIRGSTDTKQCEICGISVLSDGRLVLIDNENSNIKLLSPDYTLLDVIRLPGRPIRICSIGDNNFAVSFIIVKRINRYSVAGNTISYDGGFSTTLFNHGIGFDGKCIVAVMCDKNFSCNNNAKNDSIQIEFRNPFSGEINDVITDFKVESYKVWSLALRNTQAVQFTGSNVMIIAELNRVLSFGFRKMSGKTVAVEKSFYVCKGEVPKGDIENIATCSDSIFVCTTSGFVLQISASDFNSNRIVISNIGKTIRAIAVDEKNGRIILGCDEKDEILVYELRRKL